jgi:hypothetical protein
MKMERAAAPQFEEKAFFEYHIYDLQRRTTIKDKQTKQISLLEANDLDGNVTDLKINPSGIFSASDGVNHPSFSLKFKVGVQ